MIHNIEPHQYDIEYRLLQAGEGDIILVYRNGGLLCQTGGDGILFPVIKEMEQGVPGIYEHARYLFSIDGHNYFGLPEGSVEAFGKWGYLPKEKLRYVRPVWKAYAGITGYQIHKWYTQNRFCGCCGQRMQPHEKERAMQCPACGRISYHQICPSVIVGIIDSSRILLTKYAPGHGNFRKYALVAGYAEIGESLEDTVRREVMEEVGLRVKNIRYYKSQPWSFSDALLAGFFCEPDGNTDIVMDREELSAAGWFERESLPVERSNAEISLTGEMIEVFRNGLE